MGIGCPTRVPPHLEAAWQKNDTIVLAEMMRISKSLRCDRELAFYGSEDLTPSEFYTAQDASTALREAKWIHKAVSGAMK